MILFQKILDYSRKGGRITCFIAHIYKANMYLKKESNFIEMYLPKSIPLMDIG